MAEFLDNTGLSHLWDKIKTALSDKLDKNNPEGSGRLLIESQHNASSNAYIRATNWYANDTCAQIESDTSGNSGLVCRDSSGTYHTGIKLNGSTGVWYGEVINSINSKQNTLTAGTNIQINSDTISATDTKPTQFTENAVGGTTSLSTGASWTTVGSFALPHGIFLVNWCVNFNSVSGMSATSYRGAGISEKTNSEPLAIWRQEFMAASGVFTTCSGLSLIKVPNTGTYTLKDYFLVARQNSGVNISNNVHPRVTYVRIGDA